MNLDRLRGVMRPVTGDHDDYDALLERIGDARLVLIGEASHGTHEFYRERAKITRRLIEEKGFQAVAVEADWPASRASSAPSVSSIALIRNGLATTSTRSFRSSSTP